jgi:cytoskeleton-associated protein 5
MENKNVSVRTAAVEVIGALYHQIGPRLQAVVITDDMKPAMKQLLTVEFEKVGFDPAAQKTSKAVDSGAGGGIPRQDISSMVDKNILSELSLIEGKTSWQNRKNAMEAIIAACERSGHFIEYTKGLVEIVKALKLRVNDTQANLKPIAANAIGHIIASLDPESGSKLMKLVATCLLGGLADSKKGVRDATIASLDIAVTQNKVGKGNADPSLFASLIGPVGEALVATPNGRQELLAWMLEHVEVLKVDSSDLAVPLVIAMQDKTANVRLSAEQLLTILMSKSLVSRAVLDKATRDLPTATKRTLQPAIDRMMAAFGSVGINNGHFIAALTGQ